MNKNESALGNPIGATIFLRDADGVMHDLGVTVTGFEIQRAAIEEPLDLTPERAPRDGCRRFEPSDVVTGVLRFTTPTQEDDDEPISQARATDYG